MGISIPKIQALLAMEASKAKMPIGRSPNLPTGLKYDTAQQGPFFRVRPAHLGTDRPHDIGVRESVAPQHAARSGQARNRVPKLLTDEEVRASIENPNNFVREAANRHSLEHHGKLYEDPNIPESSLAKQGAIGRVFGHALTEDPEYKDAVFRAYQEKMPDVVKQSGARNYDELMASSYSKLADETKKQFESLPISMSFHRNGEGNYTSSKEMLKDLHGNKHMYVFQGGDPHDYLHVVDPETGLNYNEMFRAVHDFYGHGVHGNPFGPKGEEIAFGAHSNLFSPLARMAMLTETRGQNSYTNYTPINAKLKSAISHIDGEIDEATRRGNMEKLADLKEKKAALYNGFQFAPQKSVLLPPEFLAHDYAGEMPEYLKHIIKPEAGTAVSSPLTHYSTQPNLQSTDPLKYGTGIAGQESERVLNAQGTPVPRTYFYAGEPGTVKPEVGLGPNRYRSESQNLYDLASDPLSLRTLAMEANRVPYTAQANRGLVRQGQAQTDLERLIRDYGYEGYLNPEAKAAAVFQPKEIEPFAKGGLANLFGVTK